MSQAAAVVEVAAKDLQGPGVVACPSPTGPLWNQHPRVFVDLSHSGSGRCPYCGTEYRLKAGETLAAAH